MKALLTTRCNCTRELEIPYPPNKQIVIPLRPQQSLFHLRIADDDLTKPHLGIREFELYSLSGNIAYYLETRESRKRE